MKLIKKILGAVCVMFILLMGIGLLFGDDETVEQDLNQKAGAEYGDEYAFELEDGSTVTVKTPKCIRGGYIKNLTDERELALFESLYAYGSGADVDVTPVPNDDATFREMLKAPDAVGTIFNFNLVLQGGPDGSGWLAGDIQGDNSVESYIFIDPSFIGEEKYDLMGGETVNFDVIYAGLDSGSDPMFVAVKMDVLSY